MAETPDMPLLPLPVLRLLEGLIALVCLAVGALGGFIVWMQVVAGMPEVLGFQSPAVTAPLTLLFLLLAAWFGFNASRGESPTEGRERESARKR